MMDVDGTEVIVRVQGRRPRAPAWYLNLVADPRVTVERWQGRRAGPPSRATATEARGEERERLWAGVVAQSPGFAEYQVKTDRVIPVLVLQRA
jgi:deazaflavin-dependent oxidoreductase (nitroreductase family)